jgi:acetyl-CoA acetyltransferase
MSRDLEIPYGAYWSTPFSRWQGALAHLNSIEFAAHTAKNELEKKDIPADSFDYGVLGFSVPQHHSFYGLPWLMGMIGAENVGGPTLSQACATSVRCLLAANQEIESGMAETALVVTADRTSNGPHLYYPNPMGPGGTGDHEDWVMDNFSNDPFAKVAMIDTGENVARKYQITTEAQHDVVMRRTEQYTDALADGNAFHKRYMTLPFDVPDGRYRKTVATLDSDDGIRLSTREGLATLKPVKPDGTVTFGGQTHPADGNAGMVVTTPDKAADLATDPKIKVQLRGFGLSRTEKAYMPQAPVPAARRALDQAGMSIDDMDAVKTHNPFAVNDIVFATETGYDVNKMNNYGCSLIWGHPQGPTGLRSVIELIEELVMKGGGNGLFTGCAAGDTAMAVVLTVSDR